jgi:hypothetical protein
MLFAFPAGIAVPIVAGILLAGPVVGFLIAGLIALAIVLWALGAAAADEEAAAPDDYDWLAAAARRFVVPLVILAAGIVVVAVGDGTARDIGWGIIAVALTVAVSLVFLEVGLSEDRERAREQRARR